MGAPHGHALHYHGHSPVHRLPAHLKILAVLGFALLVVATPREATWPYAAPALALVAVAGVAGVPAGFLLPRMVVEAPFVVFALLLPWVAQGPRLDIWGIALSQPGLVAAWALLVKGTLGVLASLLLAATTEPRDLLGGLERLRFPALLVQIMGFMIRYVGIVAAELHRMRIARESRGFQARSPRQWVVLGRSLGALFVRTYERGERVHLAMLARGYTGRMPQLESQPVTRQHLLAAASLPAIALLAAGAGWITVAG